MVGGVRGGGGYVGVCRRGGGGYVCVCREGVVVVCGSVREKAVVGMWSVCGDKGGKGEFIQVKVHTRSGVPKNKVLVIPYRKATTLDYPFIIMS